MTGATVVVRTSVPLRGRLSPDPLVGRHDRPTVKNAGQILIGLSLLALAAGAVAGFETSVLVLALAGLTAAATLPFAPAIGLMGIVVLCAIDPVARTYVFMKYGLPHNTFNYFLLIVAIGTFPRVARQSDIRIRLLAGFVVLLGVQILLSPSLVRGLQSTFDVVAVFALVGCFLRVGSDDEVLGWVAMVVTTAAASCLLAYYFFPPAQSINGNSLVYVPVAALAGVALAVTRGAVRRWWLLGGLVTLTIALAFITASRGGFVVCALLGVYILLRTPHFRWKSYSVALAAIAFLVASATWTREYADTAAKWGMFVDPRLTTEQATSRRLDIAQFGWNTFKENPLGLGTGSFIAASAGSTLHTGAGLAAHSAWVKTMAENGVPGLLLLASIVGAFAFARPRSPIVSKALGPLVAVTMSVAFLSTEFQSKAIWLLVAGAIVLLQGNGASVSQPATGRPPGFRPSVVNRRPTRRG